MQIQVAKRLQHTEEYYFSRKLREIEALNQSGEKVINLGIGSPDLPPHPSVVETLHEYALLPHTHAYQNYQGILPLREAIANWYARYYEVSLDPNKNVLPLIGSKEGIVHICMTYLADGDEALFPNPGYPAYSAAIRLSGATGIPYTLTPENNWLPNLDALAKTDLSRVKIMWLNYPHMPTGTVATGTFFGEAVAFAKQHNILLCHDNPYSFILNDHPQSIMALEGAFDVAIELNSLSKSANMAGWRIGMLVGAEARIKEIIRFKSNMDSGMFLPAQMAAAKALSLGPEWYSELNRTYRNRREKVYQLLDTLGCSYDKGQVGLFVWAKIPKSYADGYALSDEVLHRSRVFITPGGIFGDAGMSYIRVSLCAAESTLDQAYKRVVLAAAADNDSSIS
ncbi:pyridoxal phosphate-dependent aminotransferase [Parapedobacter indicus]|uniref:Aminotransferase n=1 Tax=Parapedobacter indicus TaxID=1477437 RepID=A0A1I3QZR9_9SPHI|nr:aminotransferase class I/II-fold pyridoxal phosphate-dependent enzyme [Parapedobacter indicus]PPL00291.1 aspartate/methionine/tyrosine aminotransferase [Parapedobacter indicus]SFJ38992.1 Aspartate/methionine/tyrosine aminotransferase [Parapedobacter indicus]